MYNKDFIDIMDKINTIAKSKNFTNGIALARNLSENKQLNTYDYIAFENCHNLRNLMAHGFSRDINISDETMQIARLFYSFIKHKKCLALLLCKAKFLKMKI